MRLFNMINYVAQPQSKYTYVHNYQTIIYFMCFDDLKTDYGFYNISEMFKKTVPVNIIEDIAGRGVQLCSVDCYS